MICDLLVKDEMKFGKEGGMDRNVSLRRKKESSSIVSSNILHKINVTQIWLVVMKSQ